MTAEVWTKPKCATGSARAADLYPVLNPAQAQWQIDNADRLTLAVPRDAHGVSELRIHRIIRLTDDMGAVSEWPISEITDTHDDASEPVTIITCDPMVTILSNVLVRGFPYTGGRTYLNCGLENAQLGNFLASYVIPSLEAEGIDWISIGTIDPTIFFSLAWESWTASEVVSALAARTSTEFELERDGDTGYLLNFLTERGSTASIVEVRPDKNMLSAVRQRRAAPLRTVAVPRGAIPDGDDNEAATLAFAAWRVAAIASNTLTLEDPDDGGDPIGFDDQLNGLYVLKPDGTLTQITDSVAGATQTVTVASATGLAVGDHIEVRADSDGALLVELTNPAAVAYFDGARIAGRPEDSNARGERNHYLNGLFRTWTTQRGFYYCQANGTFSGGSATLKGLTAGHVISAGDFLSGPVQDSFVTVGGTVDGSGNVSLTISPAFSAVNDDPLLLCIVSPPDGFGHNQCPLARRDGTLAATTFSVNLDGAHSGVLQIALKNLTSGDVLDVGDKLTVGGTSAMIVRGGTANGSGQLTVTVSTLLTGADNAAVTIVRKGILPVQTHVVLMTQRDGARASYLQSPAITIRYAEDLPVLWAHAHVTLWHAGGGTTPTAYSETAPGAGTHCMPPKLALVNGGGTELATVVDEDTDLSGGGTRTVTLQAQYQLTASTQVKSRLYAPTTPSTAYAFGANGFAMAVHYMMLTLGTDPKVPPVVGSHANTLWHLANSTLADLSEEPITYTATVADLARMDSTLTHESFVLGGTVRVIDSDLGIDTYLRVVGMLVDLHDPTQTQLTFSRLSPRLTRRLATKKSRSVVQVNITNNYTIAGATIPVAEVVTVPAATDTPVSVGVDGTVRGGVAQGSEGSNDPTAALPITKVTGTRFGRLTLG
jgi:hypothetical protein